MSLHGSRWVLTVENNTNAGSKPDPEKNAKPCKMTLDMQNANFQRHVSTTNGWCRHRSNTTIFEKMHNFDTISICNAHLTTFEVLKQILKSLTVASRRIGNIETI